MKRIEYFMHSAGTPARASGTRWVHPPAESAGKHTRGCLPENRITEVKNAQRGWLD